MEGLSKLLLDVRGVGESVVSTTQDIKLLLPSRESDELEKVQRLKHAEILVENILSLMAYMCTINIENIDRHEDLSNEVRRIEFSCFGLKSILSHSITNDNLYQDRLEEMERTLKIINNSGNKIITISFIAKRSLDDPCKNYDSVSEEGCYKTKESCERDCMNGVCIEDESHRISEEDSRCPKYSETFTESPLTHVENGYEGNEKMYWHNLLKPMKNKDSVRDGSPENLGEIYREEKSNDVNLKDFSTNEIINEDNNAERSTIENGSSNNQDNLDSKGFYRSFIFTSPYKYELLLYQIVMNHRSKNAVTSNKLCKNDKIKTYSDIASETFSANPLTKAFETVSEVLDTDTNSIQDDSMALNYETTSETSKINMYQETQSQEDVAAFIYREIETSTHSSFTFSSYEDSSTQNYETTTETSENTMNYEPLPTYESTESPETTTYSPVLFSSSEDPTSSCETTTETPETTTYSYYDSYTTEAPTTPTYETTTEDMYKLSQDIYSAAQDLSTKANEISSMSSDISSKVSDMNTMVSDLNSYDDEELSKKVQSVSKLTQDINSKTSEISSLSSTTSSLASDISSASSDMTTADRNHPFRTSPWQKMSNKGQDMITATQAIVTAAQDILVKVDGVVTLASDLKVAQAVASVAFDVTVKTQRLISETLNILSSVIELMNIVEA